MFMKKSSASLRLNVEDIADQKTSALGKDEQRLKPKGQKCKTAVKQKVNQFGNDFFNGEIKPEDIDYIHGKVDESPTTR